MEKNYNVILFDLDGTLTDPKIGITKSVQYALAKFNIDEADLDKLDCFIGPPLLDSFMRFYSFSDKEALKAIEYYREYFADRGIFENFLYEGITDLLENLKESGKTLVVATSKPEPFTMEIMDHFDLTKYFDFIAGSLLNNSRSAKGDIIKYALENISYDNKDEIVMIGDRKHDIIGAQINDIDSIGVLYGYGSLEELKNASPTLIADSISTLAELLK